MPPKRKTRRRKRFIWEVLSPQPVVGVDEVGRGCLAGPVYAAAVILNPDFKFSHYTDSKLLSPERRTELAAEIRARHTVSVGFATVAEINEINILQASLLAMRRAVEGLNLKTAHVIVDGNKKIPSLEKFTQTTIIEGDLLAAPISAASIVAKVERDQVMREMALQIQGYGFEKHKGYGTKQHQEAILRLGPTSEHRAHFVGVKEYLSKRPSL